MRELTRSSPQTRSSAASSPAPAVGSRGLIQGDQRGDVHRLTVIFHAQVTQVQRTEPLGKRDCPCAGYGAWPTLAEPTWLSPAVSFG
jgi:hypothetical protein